jgi:hypothetical protein
MTRGSHTDIADMLAFGLQGIGFVESGDMVNLGDGNF